MFIRAACSLCILTKIFFHEDKKKRIGQWSLLRDPRPHDPTRAARPHLRSGGQQTGGHDLPAGGQEAGGDEETGRSETRRTKKTAS